MTSDPRGATVAAWLRHPEPGRFPFGPVVAEIRRSGKQHLHGTLLDRLARARLACPPDGADADLLRAFLDCALDKHEGRYRYQSYLGLPLLDPLLYRWRRPSGTGLLVGLLVADALRHELAVRPDDAVRRKRLRYGLRLLARHTPGTPRTAERGARAAAPGADAPGSADGPGPAGGDGPTAGPDVTAAIDALAPTPVPEAAHRIELSLQPVSAHADEYLFVRVLQSYETVFAALVRDTGRARDRLWRGHPEDAAAALAATASHFDRAGLLFSLLATMDVAAFRDFRPYTEGASAIQSERYKVFELLCGGPPGRRLRSPAFATVPQLGAGRPGAAADSVTAGYLRARERDAFTPAQWALLDAALARVERSHQLWKTAHHAIAARMIGDAPGSGYTAGVPYLRECLDNRLFWRLGERYLPQSRPGPGHPAPDGHPASDDGHPAPGGGGPDGGGPGEDRDAALPQRER